MTFAEQLADDVLIADGLAPVTLERADGASPTVIAHALRCAIISAEADTSGGNYVASDTLWHLPANALVEPPRIGDALIDIRATRWTVLEVQLLALGSRWRCRARNLAIAAGLDQLVNIERATWSQAADGSPSAAWSLWRINVAAAVQPLGSQSLDDRQRPQTRRRVQVYLAESLPLDHNHRVVHGSVVYRILDCRRNDTLDHLQTITVEPIDAPAG